MRADAILDRSGQRYSRLTDEIESELERAA